LLTTKIPTLTALAFAFRLPIHKPSIMGLEDDFKEVEDVATGQGGNDGDNNANNS
jgi:hypothetical protein